MNFKYFTFRFPQLSIYDIPHSAEKISEQEFADQAFIQSLFRHTTKSKKALLAFLDYQLENCNSKESEFVSHLEEVFKKYSYKLTPYNQEKQVVLDWISKQKKIHFPKDSPNKEVLNTSLNVSKKADPEFDDIVVDYPRMKEVLLRLDQSKIIDNNGSWIGIKLNAKKLELVALVRILVEAKVIANESNAKLGRIFSKQFNCKMNSRNYSAKIKNDITGRLKAELKDIL